MNGFLLRFTCNMCWLTAAEIIFVADYGSFDTFQEVHGNRLWAIGRGIRNSPLRSLHPLWAYLKVNQQTAQVFFRQDRDNRYMF